MMGKDQAVRPDDDVDDDDVVEKADKEAMRAAGWALYEEETDDGKKYKRGKSKGKPMKNVVIEMPNGPMAVKMTIPREAFKDMVRKYFDIKGY